MKLWPFTSDPNQQFTVSLYGSDGVASDYIVDARFNERMNDGAGGWTWDLTDGAGTVLLTSVPMVLSFNMFGPYGLGLGALFAIDSSGQNVEPGPNPTNDLGDRVQVFWLDSNDAAVFAAAGGIL